MSPIVLRGMKSDICRQQQFYLPKQSVKLCNTIEKSSLRSRLSVKFGFSPQQNSSFEFEPPISSKNHITIMCERDDYFMMWQTT